VKEEVKNWGLGVRDREDLRKRGAKNVLDRRVDAI
jgi:hypothetical protein